MLIVLFALSAIYKFLISCYILSANAFGVSSVSDLVLASTGPDGMLGTLLCI